MKNSNDVEHTAVVDRSELLALVPPAVDEHQLQQRTVTIAFGVEATTEGNRVFVILKNVGPAPVVVDSVVAGGPVGAGPDATVLSEAAFAPVASTAPLVPGASCHFVAPPAVMAALRGGIPLNWLVVARHGEKVVAEASIEGLLQAVRLCYRT